MLRTAPLRDAVLGHTLWRIIRPRQQGLSLTHERKWRGANPSEPHAGGARMSPESMSQ